MSNATTTGGLQLSAPVATCPTCGRCPTCGHPAPVGPRLPYWPAPVGPWPWWGIYQPPEPGGYKVTC